MVWVTSTRSERCFRPPRVEVVRDDFPDHAVRSWYETSMERRAREAVDPRNGLPFRPAMRTGRCGTSSLLFARARTRSTTGWHGTRRCCRSSRGPRSRRLRKRNKNIVRFRRSKRFAPCFNTRPNPVVHSFKAAKCRCQKGDEVKASLPIDLNGRSLETPNIRNASSSGTPDNVDVVTTPNK